MLKSLLEQLKPSTSSVTVSGLRGSASSLLTALLGNTGICCCILPNEHLVHLLEQDLRLFTDKLILTYPGYEIPPYTPLSPDQRTTASRLSSLYHLRESETPGFLITSIEALMRRVVPTGVLSSSVELIMVQEDIDQTQLIENLIQLGYEKVALAQSVGDFSVRGGIIDIYPPPFLTEDNTFHEGPLRLDFFGDTVESLRSFNPFTQRSTGELNEALLLPVNDILFHDKKSSSHHTTLNTFSNLATEQDWDQTAVEQIQNHLRNHHRFPGIEFYLPLFYQEEKQPTATVFDYLPDNTRLIIIEPESCMQTIQLVTERIEANFSQSLSASTPALNPTELFLNRAQIDQQLDSFSKVLCSDFHGKEVDPISFSTTNHQLLKQDIGIQRRKRGLLPPLTDQIMSWQEKGDTVVICCRSSRHTKNLAELLGKHGHNLKELIAPLTYDSLSTLSDPTSLYLCDHPLHQGFSLQDHNLHLLSESELFGEIRLGRKKKAAHQRGEVVQFAELNHGDIVVHRDHGLGIYHGLVTMEFQSVPNDFMLIEYRDGDKLYLPVDRMNLISRYEGLSDRVPKIDKLGTQSWKTIKSKVKEEVWRVAQELLDIYAKREIRQGRSFSQPAELFHELEESFPFDETPGQQKAITDTIDDLTSSNPMDRLVCGDVGYGKTEVAIRGAFKVVEDGFQAAILVPTTVLAEQHLKTFKERLQGFPVTVECINRFRSQSEQKAIVKGLKEGKIDIVIGTHRLLSKDIVYKKLGLLIIDEEHRFGVSHKEKIKRIKAEVDILTLTATPIPRTLQMSLLGIRDLSIISSPPEQRQPTKTFVAQYDDLVIKEAIIREMQRKGQIFFVHNRVKSIHRMAASVQKLVPTARVAVAHGQMAGKDLEAIMVSFVNKEIDVLICTTIIESGLDIPSANTIIVNRADCLGLAEIYQLRGRVGRSSLQSFAYLLVPSMETLSKESKERLRALMDYNDLGGGFKLAMSDLQIRGGGNLLGVSQSGHIAAIGYDLYLDLLQRTVADLKIQQSNGLGTSQLEDFEPEINLQLSAYIPASYVPDISQRYMAYRRISALTKMEEADRTDLQEEMVDRYGPLPKESINLFHIVALKKDLIELRVNKLERGRDSLVFSFREDTSLQPENLLVYLQSASRKKATTHPRLTPDGRLIIPVPFDKNIFQEIAKKINELKKL
jgi:transcription-repair coupling factor (superfamily II helicase)